VARREPLVAFAKRAEALGYDSLWVSDHVVIPWRIASRYPYNATGDFPLPPAGDFLEPLTALALVAGVTERIALGTSVMVLPHRHPVLAAKMLATIDHLAPGRVICGAGVGWMREEVELLGAPYARRGAWSDEAIRVMRVCWTEERAAFAGEFFRFDPVGCRPRPANGTIPIWIGGHTDRAFRRVVELGDGWHAAFPTRLRATCARAGRDPKTLTISARMGLSSKQSATDTVAEVRALRDLGVDHLILEPAVRDAATMTSVIERFSTNVRPHVQ
jgi:probable F420-dependent oxidoreductase